ncbi:transposase [Embleya sp. NPDC059237]|uniref:transposase n=1 Tax=Embleya sp. NPDC059237 TaxID=3346784 RepID=UPI003688EEA8
MPGVRRVRTRARSRAHSGPCSTSRPLRRRTTDASTWHRTRPTPPRHGARRARPATVPAPCTRPRRRVRPSAGPHRPRAHRRPCRRRAHAESSCSARTSTGNTGGRGRHLTLMPRPLHEIQSRVRRDQQAPERRRRYAMRAGCEATVSETVRAHGMRNCRYRGIAKTHVQHVLAAAGTNIARLSGCLPPGTMPTRTPRAPSRFQRLCDELAIPRNH